MLSDDTRKKLENIVRGKVIEGQGDTCTSIRNLCAGLSTSTTVKKDLILEDMHDENIIAKNDTLFFIDTVFYTIATENLSTNRNFQFEIG